MTAAELLAWRLGRNGGKGWTQEQAAEWYGCSVRSWRRYETGSRTIPAPLVNRINASRRTP